MTPGLSYSIENCSHIKSQHNLSTLLNVVPGSSPEVIFVDIDLLHGCHGYKPNISDEEIKDELFDGTLHWVGGYADSNVNLMGESGDNKKYQRNYLRKLKQVDKQVGDLMKEMNNEDEYIVWSDHGSNYFAYEENTLQIPKNSPAKLQKIWKPTLLIKNESLKGVKTCSELVSTVDLYSIILKMKSLENEIKQENDANLPTILGGKNKRDFAITFSTSQRQSKSRESKEFYVIKRYSDMTGEVYQMDQLPNEETKNLIEHNKLNYRLIARTIRKYK